VPRGTRLVELQLREGIVSNESLDRIGSRLWKATNAVFGYRYPRLTGSATGPFLLRQPQTFATRAAISFTDMQSIRDLGFHNNNNGGFVGTQNALVFGCNTSNQYRAWLSTGGAALTMAPGVPSFTIGTTKQLGCSVYWPNVGVDPGLGTDTTVGAVLFSHALGADIYYLMDNATTVESLTDEVTNCPEGAAALAVHLDRLWMLTNYHSGGFSGVKSHLKYTDPFNLDSIRSTSVIVIPDIGTCLLPGQFGTTDASGVAHLIIGGRNSVSVLDGDPQLGGGLQANLRVLNVGVGIPTPHAAAQTPYGAFFLGTDHDLWLIPPGCQTMQAVGAPIRDKLGINNKTGTLDDYEAGGVQTSLASVVWYPPYLYLYPGGESSSCLIAEPSQDGLTFWGPVTMDASITGREAVIRVPAESHTLHANSSVAHVSVHSCDILPVTGVTARYLVFDDLSIATGSYPHGQLTGRTASIQSGLVNVPGHTIEPMRVILETLRVPQVSAADVTWTVSVADEKGNSVTLVRHPEAVPTAGTYLPYQVATQHYVMGSQALPAARGLSVTISSTAAAHPAILRAALEARITPAQF
jgi:hypothetical protein